MKFDPRKQIKRLPHRRVREMPTFLSGVIIILSTFGYIALLLWAIVSFGRKARDDDEE